MWYPAGTHRTEKDIDEKLNSLSLVNNNATYVFFFFLYDKCTTVTQEYKENTFIYCLRNEK